jgi:urease accessory protein
LILPRATDRLPAGSWAEAPADSVTLPYHERHHRRRRFKSDGGMEFMLDLPRAEQLAEGDALRLESGALVAVRAAPEALIAVTAATPALLMRCAYHLGNRHLPVQLDAERLLIQTDSVIAEMLVGLGARVDFVQAPFQPEGGAYAPAGHHHHHDDDDDHHHHDHHHGHGHDH